MLIITLCDRDIDNGEMRLRENGSIFGKDLSNGDEAAEKIGWVCRIIDYERQGE